jgi:hypothetical protein
MRSHGVSEALAFFRRESVPASGDAGLAHPVRPAAKPAKQEPAQQQESERLPEADRGKSQDRGHERIPQTESNQTHDSDEDDPKDKEANSNQSDSSHLLFLS